MLRRSALLCAASVEHVVAALRVLGIEATAAELREPQTVTPALVRSRYLDLARRHHPDLSSGDDTTMKVINAAYELVQANTQFFQETDGARAGKDAASPTADKKGEEARFVRRAGLRRRRLPDDFADGESWAMKSQMDWESLVGNVSEQELQNPANHPFSHSRHFSFEDDATIYRMIRGGATVPQVARSLGKPATFIEKRLQNAQFKQRVQYVLRSEKRERAKVQNLQRTMNSARRQASGASLYEETGHAYQRKAAWEATKPHARPYWNDMTVEEKAEYSNLIDREHAKESGGERKTSTEHHSKQQKDGSAWHSGSVASKVGKSYANYSRLRRK